MPSLSSLSVIGHAVYHTLKISVPTVIEAHRGTLTASVCNQRLRSWAEELLRKSGVQVQLENEENIHLEQAPFVIVSNHASLYDIPVLFASLPLNFRMAAKRELFSTPIWGRALQSSGFVQIDRSSPGAAYDALHEAGKLLRERGLSLYVAPEGTRTPDGSLGKFKKGAFGLARATGFPILPIAILGTRGIHARGSGVVHRGQHIRVRILKPIFADAIGDLAQTADAVRREIEVALLDLSQEVGSQSS